MHSTFSDGARPDRGQHRGGRGARADRARLRRPRARRHRLGAGLRRGGAAAARRDRRCELRCGIEAKLLDTTGALDLPAEIDGVDAIYAADHQVPLAERAHASARGARADRRAATSSAAEVVDAILTVDARARSTARSTW